MIPTHEADVVVAGAGAAGMAAALAAARAGAAVWLVEAAPGPGGTVANALIHTLGGLYDGAGEPLNGGLARELIEALTRAGPASPRRMGRTWVLQAPPELYRAVTRRWLDDQPRLTLLRAARVTEAACSAGHVEELGLSTPSGPLRLRPRAVVDATGTAEVVRLVDPELVHDGPGRAAGGLIVRLRGVAPGALAFPRGLAAVRALRRAAEEGRLPADCAHAWLDTGVRDDEAYLKLFVPLPEGWRAPGALADLTQRSQSQAGAALAFLRDLDGLAGARVERVGALGVRDGGRVVGVYCLTGADVRQGRTFPDAACRACWPIEYWCPQRGPCVEHLPGPYDIPLRALEVRGMANLWAAGKCLSADAEAHASARVAGTCWSMGEAAGKAAARGARSCH
jgi:2-polyprenyl-6-methoxyphenol hydroxylase-like FAD-dependent oxidoreductase